jgi:hypothetical protein
MIDDIVSSTEMMNRAEHSGPPKDPYSYRESFRVGRLLNRALGWLSGHPKFAIVVITAVFMAAVMVANAMYPTSDAAIRAYMECGSLCLR